MALLAVRAHGRHAMALNGSGRGQAEDGEDVARANALQRRRGVSSEAPPEREERAVEEDKGYDNGDEDDDAHGARRHGEATQGVVHGEGLQDGEVDLRAERDAEDNGRAPERQDAEHRLEVLHLLHRAYAPRPQHRPIHCGDVAGGDQCSAVQEAEIGCIVETDATVSITKP